MPSHAAAPALPPYLAALNPEQREAVEATEGPLLVLAGAGTGKTRVLTTRIAHILNRRLAWPGQILAVTFTNKAAREMGERVQKLIFGGYSATLENAYSTHPHQSSHSLPLADARNVSEGGRAGGNGEEINGASSSEAQSAKEEAVTGGGGVQAPWGRSQSQPAPQQENPQPQRSPLTWLGTFHSVAARILRRHAEGVGLASTFTILDTDDQIRVIKALLAERNIDEKNAPAKQFLGLFSGWKDLALTAEKITPVQLMNKHPRALELYTAYNARLKALGACDFGDLLLHNITLFQQNPALLMEYAQRFKYILVDEYQDTNVAQYLWLRLLSVGHMNVCCVGDDDQSIYGWRGAEVGNILRFEKDFANAKVIRLERNYRSTPHILAAASHLIGHNKGRLGKTLWTEEASGEKLKIAALWDDAEEARHVGDEIEMLQTKGYRLSEMAVLVRAGFQTRAFEERLLTLGLAYRVVGGLRFYERQEVRDTVAYLRVVLSKEDDLAFERIVNVPKRGIGKATLESLFLRARREGISLYDATERLLEENALKGKVGNALAGLIVQFEAWRHEAKALPLPALAEKLLEESGYRAMWVAEKTPEAQGKLENLKELVRAMGEFEDLATFLEHVGLVAERSEEQGADMISLMTLHAAKGLEFRAVFLPGWEEGLFPHMRALDESGAAGLEEERRLAYVGITRARERLFISHAASRRIYNQWQSSVPSRFLSELPEEHVEEDESAPLHRSGGRIGGSIFSDNRRGLEQEIARIMAGHMGYPPISNASGKNTGGRNLSERDLSNPGGPPDRSWYPGKHGSGTHATSGIAVGDRVFHLKFGYGRVGQINGEHLDIEFEKAGAKKVMRDYVEKVK